MKRLMKTIERPLFLKNSFNIFIRIIIYLLLDSDVIHSVGSLGTMTWSAAGKSDASTDFTLPRYSPST